MKTSLVLALFQITICSSPLSVPPNYITDNEASNGIYSTDVLDDLSSLEDFDSNSYEGKGFDFIYLAEYNYKETSSAGFDLIFYFYTVYSLTSKIDESKQPYINIQANAGGYDNLDIEVINSNGYFYKAKLVEPQNLYVPFLEQRTYDLAGLSTFSHYEDQNENWNDNKIGKSYTFSGLASNDTLSCTTSGLETISIEVKGGAWHTASNYGHRTTIFYVWFGLTNTILPGYHLHSIHYEYDRLKLKSLIACGDDVVVGGNVYLSLDSFTLQAYTENGELLNDIRNDESRWFDIEKHDEEIGRDRIEEKYQKYGSSMVDQREYINQKVTNTDNTITIPSSNMNAFEKFWVNIFQDMGGSSETYEDIASWEVISADDVLMSDDDFASKFYIDEKQASDIKGDTSINLINFKDTYLFRFDMLPYYSRNVFRYVRIPTPPILAPNKSIVPNQVGYYFDTYICANFDIISFSFVNDNMEIEVIPVVADPIDIFDSAEKPDQGFLSDLFDSIKNIIQVILTIVLVIILVVVLVYIVKIIIRQYSMSKSVERALKKQEKKKKKNESNKR